MVAGSLVFLLLAGGDSLVLRAQLTRPVQTLLGPRDFNQLFTMHGTAMVFLFALPAMLGLAVYLLPPALGRHDLPLGWTSWLASWLFLIGGIGMYASTLPDLVNLLLPGTVLEDLVPFVGWTGEPPLSLPRHSPGPNTSFWIAGVLAATLAATVVSANLAGAVLFGRRAGVALRDLPPMAWSVLASGATALLLLPPVAAAAGLLALERLGWLAVFDPAVGGDALLWRRLFWLLERPEAQAGLLPAVGVISAVVADRAGRPIGGGRSTTAALLAGVPLTALLWPTRVLAPLPDDWRLPLAGLAAALVLVPTGVLLAAWCVTLRRGRATVDAALLFALAAAAALALGAVTSAATLLPVAGRAAGGTYLEVAHLHYVLLGGALFPLLAAVHRWFAEATGRALDEPVARASFWLWAVGAGLAFLPQHALGLLGMPRRVYTYDPAAGFETLNLLSTAGAAGMALGTLAVALNVAWSLLVAGEAPSRATD
jgi:cytochrome c oxidase subunit I+III